MATAGEQNEGATATGPWTCPTCGITNPADFALCPRDGTPRAEASNLIDPLLGEVLGRAYKITRMIGEGGMARLYEAEHLRVEGRYAVKIIHGDLARDPSLLARFEREARAAGRIRSEHVVRLYDVLRTADGRPCLVTELLHGEDLQAMLDRRGKLGVHEAIPIARQICRAVAAAHAVGVVHRDLKPSNVFLCKTEQGAVVKVFDFGVAKLEDDDKLTRTDAVMGTAAYMAPEQARSAAGAGPIADVYSVGAVLYHMLTGQPPYGNVPAVSRLALVLHEEPERPRQIEPGIPDAVEAVIQNAMARDTAGRVRTPQELDEQLAALEAPVAPVAPARISASMIAAEPAMPRARTASDATEIALRARRTRPLAGFVAVASSIAAGAWLAALLAAMIGAPTGSERTLIALLGLVMTGGVGLLQLRILKPRWRSAPAVARHAQPATRALAYGIGALGALELVSHGFVAVFGDPILGPGVRLFLSGGAAAVGLGWQRLGLDEKLRRQIG